MGSNNPKKTVFYVLAYFGASTGLRRYVERIGTDGSFHPGSAFDPINTAQKAQRFASVSDLLAALRQSGPNGLSCRQRYEIVRVEETPGSEQRVVLGETEAAPAGATVKYAVKSDNHLGPTNGFMSGPPDTAYFNSVGSATLFDTDSAALKAMIDSARNDWPTSTMAHMRVIRIAILPGASTFTETVLA